MSEFEGKLKEYPYRWDRKARPPGRKGQACRILKGAKSEVCEVEFKDGATFHVVRKGLVK